MRHINPALANNLVSAGTRVENLSSIVFSNSNGLSFGLHNGVLTGTVATNYAAADAYLTTAALSDHSHGNPTLALTNLTGTTASASNGFTLSLSAAAPGAGGGIAAAAGTQTGTSGTVVFANSNGMTFGMSDSSQITASYTVPSVAAFLTTAMLSNASSVFAGVGESMTTTAGTDLKMTVNTDGVSIAHPAWLTTAQAPGAYLTTARASNDAVGLNTAQTNVTWTVNSSGISINGSGYAGTATAATNATFTLNSAGLSLSVAAPGGGAGVTMMGGYSNLDYFTATVTLDYKQSTSHVVPFFVPNNLSFDYVRIRGLPVVLAASTTAATAGTTTFSCGYTKSHNLHIYSMGTGANFNSLQLYTSTQFVENFSHQVSCNATQFTYSNGYTLPCSSGNSAFAYNYSSSAASMNINSAGVTGLTGTKIIEIPFGGSLTPGRWFLMYGASSTTSTQVAGTTIGLRNAVTYNPMFQSQAAQSIGVWGAATSNIYGPQQGLGSFTTVGGATTGSLHVTKVTVSAAHPMLIFNLMKSA